MKEFRCHKIAEGKAKGKLLISPDPLCFYLVDPKTGAVIEKNHPLFGKIVAGRILMFPNGKGSSVVQADGLYQLKMTGNEPKAMIVKNPDTTLVASAIIMEIPLVDELDEDFYTQAADGAEVTLDTEKGMLCLKEAN